MLNPIPYRCLVFVSLCTILSPLFAQEFGETVQIRGALAEDIYAAGGTVDVLATADGDVVIAGGRVTVSGRVHGDVIAAGGTVSVVADSDDDVRLAGGDIRISGSVGDDAIAAGGNVTLAPDGNVKGRAWFSGGRIDVSGMVGRELKVTGGRIVLSGRVNGDVILAGRDISILDSAIIDGDLVYRSPREAKIASGAQIRGRIRYEPVERPVVAVVAAVAGAGIIVLLGLVVTGSLLFLMFPRFIATVVKTIPAEPWKCLGLGLAVFAATPVVISLFFMTVIGWLPAIVLVVLYPVLLLAGFLTGLFLVADLGWRLLGRDKVSRVARLGMFALALIVVMLLGLIPLFGTLLLFAVLLLGVGGLNLGLYRVYVLKSVSTL